jgi:hypothetical protein
MCWTGTIPHSGLTATTPAQAPGWCSGSAGHAILWTLAHATFGDSADLDLARRAGHYAIDHPATGPDLCCGLTGRALGLLELHRATGETEWLNAARRLAASAAAGWPDRVVPFGLRRGPLGTALLLAELETPESAVLPPMFA